jgi:CheY-like chemotaxis protein
MEGGLPHGSETILLVDDEDLLRATTARILEHVGYRVIEAASAEEALRLASESDFQLLLMDVVLPQMSGFSLAHEIAIHKPEIRILYSSGYATDRMLEEQWEKRPGVGFIQKPFTAGAMARAVRELLDKRLPEPGALEPIPRGTESVLVVDDDANARRFVVKSLEHLGYHILEAQDPERGLTIALKSRVDLVVTDLDLPGMTGRAMARAIATERPHLRYLFVSGNPPVAGQPPSSAEAPGAMVLSKPFSAAELGEAVRRALDAPL